MTHNVQHTSPYSAAKLIREIGRGKEGAKHLSRELAHELFGAILDGRVSDLELGAILIAFRIKGESIHELAGFLDACDSRIQKLQSVSNEYSPIIIPSYNGARKKANLTPLLAMALARQGVPVLVHGLMQDPGRVCSSEIFAALGIPVCTQAPQVYENWRRGLPAFMPLENLCPSLYRVVMKRQILGLRNSAHTLVKMLHVFDQASVRLVSYTHPEYALTMDAYFSHYRQTELGAALLLRATEGEAVANAERAQQMNVWYNGLQQALIEKQSVIEGAVADLPSAIDAATTATWIRQILDDETMQKLPPNIKNQIDACWQVSSLLKQGKL